MKKITLLFVFILLILPLTGKTSAPEEVTNTNIIETKDSAVLTWKNPVYPSFLTTILFRSPIPIAEYFTYEAVEGLCELVYDGTKETYTDTDLKENLPYYYILFTKNKKSEYSKAVILKKRPIDEIDNAEKTDKKETTSLAGVDSITVNQVSRAEALTVYNFNQEKDIEISAESRRLSLFIIVKSPHNLDDNDKNAISYFIHEGTPTTVLLGGGERAGVLNSYLSVFNKLPTNTLEWQDIIKIANGRWPEEKNLASEKKAADIYFNAIYKRKADMGNPNDNAAVTVIAYGLRPGNRNLASEKNAIQIFQSIFNKAPTEAGEWDMVRAIAYSGAVR